MKNMLAQQSTKQSSVGQDVNIHQLIRAHVQHELGTREKLSQRQQQRVNRYQMVKQSMASLLDDIQSAAVGKTLSENGVVENEALAVQAVFPEFCEFVKQSGYEAPETFESVLQYGREKLAEAMAEEVDSKAELEEALVEASAEDPDMAAKLISMETGADVDADDVEDITQDVAEGSVVEEEADEDEMPEDVKKDLAKTSSLYASLPPLSKAIVTAIARVKKSHIQSQLARQRAASE